MWELDCEESWAPKNWCFWTVVLEKTLVGPLDCKEIQPVHPKGDQSWLFIGRTDAEAETPILWPPHGRVDSLKKTLMLGWIGGRRRGRQRMRWLDGISNSMHWVWMNSGSWWWTGRPGVLRFMGSQRVGHDWVTELNTLVLPVHQKCWTHSHSTFCMKVFVSQCLCHTLPSVTQNYHVFILLSVQMILVTRTPALFGRWLVFFYLPNWFQVRI